MFYQKLLLICNLKHSANIGEFLVTGGLILAF